MQQNIQGFKSNRSRVKETEHKLININATWKSFRGPNHGWFQELRHEMFEFVHLERKMGVSNICEVIKSKAWVPAKWHIMWHQFKDSMGWGICIIQKEGFSPHWKTSHCQILPAKLQETNSAFQWHVTELHNEPNVNLCILHKSRDICELSSYNASNSLWSSLGRTLPFQRFMLNLAGRIPCSSETGGYASSSVATGCVTQARQISAEEPDKECPKKRRMGRLAPSAFANFSRAAHPKIKAWPSMLRVGHEVQNLILGKKCWEAQKGSQGQTYRVILLKKRTEFL